MGSAQPEARTSCDKQVIEELHLPPHCTLLDCTLQPGQIETHRNVFQGHSASLCVQRADQTQPNIRLVAANFLSLFIFVFLTKCQSEARRVNQNKTLAHQPPPSSSQLRLGTVAALGDVFVGFKVRTRSLQRDLASHFRQKRRHLAFCRSQTGTFFFYRQN